MPTGSSNFKSSSVNEGFTMRRLVVQAPGPTVIACTIAIEPAVPVPRPSSGQVLIKVVAAAINPSDYGTWTRTKAEHCPLAMGSEGCGVVVALGGGLATYAAGVKVGSKVGFVNLPFRQGAYSEFVVADVVGGVFPMPDDLPVESAASFFTNPYTAIAIIDTVKKEGASAFVHTAAASQLGQMIARLAPSEGIEVIHVVRRDEQAQLLRDIGANHIVVSGTGNGDTADDSAWKKELRSKVDELGATVAFDAVSGASTGDMLDALPRKGTTYLYGGLAGRAANIDPMHLIYSQKKLKGFLVTNWIKEGGLIAMGRRILAAAKKVNEGLGEGGWSCSQFLDTTMECAQEDLVALLGSGKSTGKKLRIRFDKA